MAIAHIIVEIEEHENTTGFDVILTYSGRNDLKNQDAQTAFNASVLAIQEALEAKNFG